MIGTYQYLSGFHKQQPNMYAMKYSFFLKKDHKNREGKYPLYLNLYIHEQRKRIPVELFLFPKEWDDKKKFIATSCESYQDYKLILEDIKSNINKIEIQFRLSREVLTVEKCAELLRRPDLSIDFISFMQYELDLKRSAENTKKNHRSVIKKLREYRKSILFSEVNDKWILKFRKYLGTKKENQEVTIDNNIKILKHYIKLAKKRGLVINVDLDDIIIKQHRSHRTNLTLAEVEKMKSYYYSPFIKPAHFATLGYFLFNCMTGQRIEDLLKMERHQLNDTFFNFWNQKSKKSQILMTNTTCKNILEKDPKLFIDKITAKTINETIKDICILLGIKKHVTCHVARHTFATNYLRKGGKVEDLQVLLGHSEIDTTMIYVHIVEGDVVKSMTLLD
ncbi:site-specific integrase [Elizabethkingia anophelis]|uniref:site-specific integrase n=1 Tax=Elizabethkingia anophelis TaxID=1117645 RepID=UPI0024E22F12|nr:site-specific integrase [Elizabethkingia anophelis]CAH1144040.1 Tyrosine recombinase XerC [Elizabethkingia anophelis]CAI9670528.1 Tyrosine recombinase XerC [Elizabethkingia anophelis]CAI9673196.1 Tyrosine recombinase XerC [Elizabethkingia anophelis]CAI9678102.1 Tyrosine recombinase XerC [Elizabethkingia anophelis]